MRTRPAARNASAGAATGAGASVSAGGESSCSRGEVEVVHAVDFKNAVMGDRLAADAGECAQAPSAVEAAVA